MTQEQERQIEQPAMPEQAKPRKRRAKSGGQPQQSQRPPERQDGGMPQQGDQQQQERPPMPNPVDAAGGEGHTPPATNEEKIAPV